MEKTLISWSVPNLLTIWLMLAAGFLAYALVAQYGLKALGGSSQPANNSGGY